MKNPIVKWDTSASVSVTRLLLKAQSIILKCKGQSFYNFAPLRSGNNVNADGDYALYYSGPGSRGGVDGWLSVRPALQLAQNKSF